MMVRRIQIKPINGSAARSDASGLPRRDTVEKETDRAGCLLCGQKKAGGPDGTARWARSIAHPRGKTLRT